MQDLKKFWHKENRPKIHELNKGQCFRCLKKVGLKEGVAHHLTYSNVDGQSTYLAKAERVFELGYVRFCCHQCHAIIHANESIDGLTEVIELKRCTFCGTRKNASLFEVGSNTCKYCIKKSKPDEYTYTCTRCGTEQEKYYQVDDLLCEACKYEMPAMLDDEVLSEYEPD